MLAGFRLFLLLPLGALLACGSSTSAAGGYGAPTGNWILTVSPGTAAASNFVGALTVNGTSATGVFHFNTPGLCVPYGQDIPFTGAIVNNVLTLTSSTYSGSVATVSVQLPLQSNTAGIQSASGTIQVANGSCALTTSPLVATYLPADNGTWNGALNGPVNGTVSLAVTVSAANADGQFPATGTATFTGSTCSVSLVVSGLVSGYNLQLTDTRTTPDTVTLTTSNTPAPLTMSLTAGQTCPAGAYTGNVTRQ